MHKYSSLTPAQRKQVTHLFADDCFGSDVSAFLYDVDANGDVSGRSPITMSGAVGSTKGVRRLAVQVRAAHVTDAQRRSAMMRMDALAASVAERIEQLTLEEVSHD